MHVIAVHVDRADTSGSLSILKRVLYPEDVVPEHREQWIRVIAHDPAAHPARALVRAGQGAVGDGVVGRPGLEQDAAGPAAGDHQLAVVDGGVVRRGAAVDAEAAADVAVLDQRVGPVHVDAARGDRVPAERAAGPADVHVVRAGVPAPAGAAGGLGRDADQVEAGQVRAGVTRVREGRGRGGGGGRQHRRPQQPAHRAPTKQGCTVLAV